MNKISNTTLLGFFTSILLVLLIFLTLLSVYFGNNPLNKSNTVQAKFISAFPQGWAFFTSSAKKPRYYVFNCPDKNIEMIELRSFSTEYYFGISRHNRILNIEINNLFQKIISDSIKGFKITTPDIKNITQKIKNDTLKFDEISIDKKHSPNLKGKYLFVTQLMLPWSLLNKRPDYPSLYTVYAINIHQK
jgi:hypothetical protein